MQWAAIIVATIAAILAEPMTARAAPCELPNADTTVHGIRLGDTDSTIRVLGRDFTTIVDNPASDFGWSIFASRDNKQLLLLRHHAGDLQHSYLEFEVKFGRHDRHPMKLPVYEFVSGRKIRLGMKRKAVVAIFGPCFKSARKGDTETIRYQVEDGKAASPILKASNMPQYYAEYEFRNGVLVRFRFGHEPV